MLKLLETLCTYVFPEREDHRVVRLMTSADARRHLSPATENGIIYLMRFREPEVRALIHEAKFHHNERAWKMLGEILAEYLRHVPSDTLIMPIPLSAQRRWKRGYNQVEEVAKRAAKLRPNVVMGNGILRRTRDTKAQTSLDRTKRRKNMAGAFACGQGDDWRQRHVIIIDDVYTTGSTLKAALAAVQPLKPASITLLALAH